MTNSKTTELTIIDEKMMNTETSTSKQALIKKPQITLDLEKVRNNIGRVSTKLKGKGVFFRPHFKTHQCAGIGEIFREAGTTAITVSSLDMAQYFAEHGWQDITLAVPVNLGQLNEIRQLAKRIKLNLLVDCPETTVALSEALGNVKCPVWIKIDVGYGRVGIRWDKEQELVDLVRLITAFANLDFCGLLTHSGHTYDCRGSEEVLAVFDQGRQRMLHLQKVLQENGWKAKISMGDTPSASLAEDFDGVDEMRPGNFVFYDLVQAQVGSCKVEDIAVATACPVIGKYEDELKIVIYGGSAHLSKDSLFVDGLRIFGQLALPTEKGWEVVPVSDAKVISCCQEVTKIKVSQQIFEQISLGQTIYILPAHSCLAADIHAKYITTGGEIFERFKLY